MSEHESRLRRFILDSGIGPDTMDSELFIRSFIDQMQRGINKQPSSLGMIPTYLSCEERLPLNEYAVAIDAGGTNFRTALLCFREDGAVMEHYKSYPMPGTKAPVSWEEFISFAADCVRPLMQYTERIGICISFPTTVFPDSDGVIEHFTKEVNISGFEGRHVCRDLLAALNIPSARACIINDTAAVLLSALAGGAPSEGLVGLINGTGTNTCVQVPCRSLGLPGDGRMIVDIESGGFKPPQRSDIDLRLDAATASPGVYTEEKLVSGAYLGEICRLALIEAAGQGLFSKPTAALILRLSQLQSPIADSLACGVKPDFIADEADLNAAAQIAQAVYKRAAKHIACTLSAIYRFSGTAAGSSVTVSADGSVFRKSSVFRAALEDYTAQYCPQLHLSFTETENATIIGTAIAALIN